MRTDPDRILDEEEHKELRWRMQLEARVHAEIAQKCQHKTKFASKILAEQTISRRIQGKVHAYHCDICHHWHLGGSKHVIRAKRAKKRILAKRREACG